MSNRVIISLVVEANNDIDSERGEWHSDHVQTKDNVFHLEPYVGMEFGSEHDARKFYDSYAQKAGFVIQPTQSRDSERVGKTLALRRIGCNYNYKQASFPPNLENKNGAEKEKKSSRPGSRNGCTASVLLKLGENGKWKVTKFIKDHNHPPPAANKHIDLSEKYKKIQELAEELKRQEAVAADYRERLINLLTDVEKQADHLSSKVLAVVRNVKKAEAEALTCVKSYS